MYILQKLLTEQTISADEIQKELKVQFDYMITEQEVDESAKVLQGHFTSKDAEYQKYKEIGTRVFKLYTLFGT